MADGHIVKFLYKNHRGEVAERTVLVESLEYNREPGYGYAPGWFLTGLCRDKGQRRSFSLDNIILPDDRVVRVLKL